MSNWITQCVVQMTLKGIRQASDFEEGLEIKDTEFTAMSAFNCNQITYATSRFYLLILLAMHQTHGKKLPCLPISSR